MLIRVLFIGLLFIGVPKVVLAQQNVNALAREARDLYGFDKLKKMVEVIAVALEEDTKSALKYTKQAEELIDNLYEGQLKLNTEEAQLKARALNQVGLAYFENERYDDAYEYFTRAYTAAQRQGDLDEMTVAAIYSKEAEINGGADTKGFGATLKDKVGNMRLGGLFESKGQQVSISTAIKLGDRHAANGNYRKGIEQYNKAINKLQNLGDYERIRQLELVIADWQVNSGNYEEAIEIFEKNDANLQDTSDMSDRVVTLIKELEVLDNEKSALEANSNITIDPEAGRKAPVNTDGITSAKQLVETARQLEINNDYAQSIEYYKIYVELQEKLAEEEKQRELAIQEKNFEIEQRIKQAELANQQRQIQALELKNRQVELDRRLQITTYLLVGLGILILVAIIIFWLYRTKRRDHKKLTVAYSDLDSANHQLAEAEQRIKTLLTQQVSGAVAEELIGGKAEKEVSKKFVAIMFLDIRGFTPFAESRDPEEIIQYQNDVFGFMIDIINEHGGVINQFMGDGFMATFGAPVNNENDTQRAYLAGLEIIKKLNEKNEAKEVPPTKVGIGLHAGWVVAGNVGNTQRMQYSITGNTVITAARLEQLNKQYESSYIISEAVLEHLDDDHRPEGRIEKVALKGRSEKMSIMIVNSFERSLLE